jgi:cytidine deaminase
LPEDRLLLTPELRAALLQTADQAALHAHAPYSRFRVGAAVLAEGVIHMGCNVENASSNLGLCAERVAITAAVAAGRRSLSAVAISFPDLPALAEAGQRAPCGACRQVMAEFAGEDLPVITRGAPDARLGDLLPRAFRLQASAP